MSVCVNIRKHEADTLQATSTMLNGKNLTWIGIALGVFLAAGMFLMLAQKPQSVIEGRVVSSDTKAPVPGVMVYVHSIKPHEEEGLNEYTTTDETGRFKAGVSGEVSLRVWKPGYAPRDFTAGHNSALSQQEITIEIRKLTATNLVTKHDEFYQLKPGEGFSFEKGKVVESGSSEADIVLVRDSSDMTSYSIESQGNGGIIFQKWGNDIDFDNSPEAPLDGYEKRAPYFKEQEGFYVVRTRDGKHYAKFRLLTNSSPGPGNSTIPDFEFSRMIWAFQPDGTRGLEIKPGKNLSFPVEAFGLSRDKL